MLKDVGPVSSDSPDIALFSTRITLFTAFNVWRISPPLGAKRMDGLWSHLSHQLKLDKL